MVDKAFQGDTFEVNYPLTAFDAGTATSDELPPPYEYPTIDVSNGWKDRVFGVVFWIQMLTIIIAALLLSILIIPSILIEDVFKGHFHEQNGTVFNDYIKISIYALGGTIAMGTLMSFMTYFLLQLCAGRIIICTFVISILIEGILGVVLLLLVHWSASIVPFCLLLFTLILMCCVRKRIPFAEAHLRVGCAVLRSHPSLILVTLVMIIVQMMWLAIYLLTVVGLRYALQSSAPIDTLETSQTDTQASSRPYLHSIIGFVLLLSWYWGAVTFANVVHFVTACTVGRWWFGNKTDQQYTIGNSIKRALTRNFGTICLGSLLEAILKATRSSIQDRRSKSIFACVARCIFQILEKIIGYINEWAIVYTALSGQSFVQASRSFIELFKKRGWTMIINDTLIEHCLSLINILVALTSAVIGGLIMYIFVSHWSDSSFMIIIIICASCISFLVGFLFSVMTTTILTSCVRTVFVCFALNPAALGATHPDHLQHLTKVWHKFYPTEFATSGYAEHYPTPYTADKV